MQVRFSALLALVLSASVAHASISLTTRPGAWCDVVAGPGGLTFVRALSTAVVAERPDLTQRWAVTVPEPTLYLRAAADASDAVEAVAQGNSTGTAYVFSATGIRTLGSSFGQNAVAIGWTVSRGFTYYVQTSPSTYVIYDHAGCAPCGGSWAATSQGFRDILPDGTIIRGDDAFSGVFNGRRLWEPMTRGAVTVGQGDPAAIYAAADGRTFTVMAGDGFEPHVALMATGFVVAARTGAGAAFAIVTPPYPIEGPPTGGNPPIDPPKKPIDPPPAPTQGVPDESATVKAVAAANPFLLAKLRTYAKDCHTDADSACAQVSVLKGEMTRRIAWAVYQHDHRWGLRLKTGGTNAIRPADGKPLSTDVLMWHDDGQIVDVMSDTDAGWGGARPGDVQPIEQWVQPLPEGDAPPPPPPPPPPSGPDPRDAQIAALTARVASLEEEVAVLNGQAQTGQDLIESLRIQVTQKQTELDALKNRPAPGCEAKVPAYLKSLGIKVGCQVIQK